MSFYAPDKIHKWEDLGRAKGRVFPPFAMTESGVWYYYTYYADHWWRRVA